MRTRGFTLLELAAVLAIIGTLAALAAPGYRDFLLRGRAAEARSVLESIANSQFGYHRDHGHYLACAPTADAPPPGTRVAFDAARPGWSELGFRVDEAVRFQYEVTLEGATFLATARGDLDGDGQASTYVLRGDTLAFSVRDELE